MTLWGGRFQGETDPLFRALNDSLGIDHRLAREDIEGSIAWARALVGAGVLTPAEADRLVKALTEILAQVESDPHPILESGEEDIHSWVEAQLVARVGALGKKLHTGRSRNDQAAADLRRWTMRRIDERIAEMNYVRQSLVELAEREFGVIMPGFTHLQRAQPILFSHWCLAYFEMLGRDVERFADARKRSAQCPLGAAALAGTAFPIDREALAKSLGFDAPTANSLDAVSDRDFVVETLSAAALCAVHLSRLAEDLVFYASGEASFVELDDATTSGSSIMPQKKNPDALELVRGKVGRVLGALVSLLTTMKGLPLAYNKDMQEDKQPLFDAMDQLSLSLRILPTILNGLRLNRDTMRRAAQGGYANATELADYLVSKGVPFREAHETVGKLVRLALDAGTALESLPLATLQQAESRIGEDVFACLALDAAAAKRDVLGGTAPARVRAALEQAKAALARGSADRPTAPIPPTG